MTTSDKNRSDAPRREKKPKPLPITKLYPGTAEVATAMNWSVEVTRLVADLHGCPRVRGGKGKRFTSIEAFKTWFDGLDNALKRSVPEIDKQQRIALGEEIAALTLCAEDGLAARLARDHDYNKLVAMRDYWRDRDDEEKGERAAAEVLGKPVPW